MSGTLNINSKRYISLFHPRLKNYYEALGLSQKATQADIKAAYYKLSMIYHPDRNQGCKEATTKFQIIKSAYEVLSDYKSRKLYDRGLWSDIEVTPSSPSDFEKPSGPTVQKTRPIMTGRTPIYNYDEWSKAHYGGSFSRRAEARARFEERQRFQETSESMSAAHNVSISIGLVILVLVILSAVYEDNDKPIFKDKRS